MSGFGPDDLNRVRRSFELFATNHGASATPLYTRLAQSIAANDVLLNLFESVEKVKRRPVVLFAAVHYLLLDGARHELASIYDAADRPRSLDRAPEAFADFCDEFEGEIIAVMNRRSIQTNEVNRMTAFLPALMHVHRQSQKSLALVEVGASAGLNLLFDRYRYDYVNGPAIGLPGAGVRLHSKILSGRPYFDDVPPPVDYRVGIDLEPLDLNDEDSLLWLRACIFAGDVGREARLLAAAELARREWVDVKAGDVSSVLPSVVEGVPANTELCVFNSWTMSWMSADERQQLAAMMVALAARRTIWWLTYEQANKVPGVVAPDGVEKGDSLLALQRFTSTGVQSHALARVHHHGAWLEWFSNPSF